MSMSMSSSNNNNITTIIDDGGDIGDGSGFTTPLLIFAAVMTFLIMIVGIVGNFLTVVALVKCQRVRNVAAAFIISLCLADLLFCSLVLPFSALRFVQGTWTHGEVLCQLIPFIQYGNIGVSLLCIAMITINRYVMITHHRSYARIYRPHWIAAMIAFCWLFAYGMQLPTLLGIWGRFGYDPRLQTCSIMNDAQGNSSKTTLFVTAFVIPCLIIVACYTKIFWVVHKSEQRMKQHASKQHAIPNNLRTLPISEHLSRQQPAERRSTLSNASTDSSYSVSDTAEPTQTQAPSMQAETALNKPRTTRSGKEQQREVRSKRNEWRITKMVLAIFLSFVICYLPITIVKVADKDVEYASLHIFSYIMLYMSACINPIIYVIMNKQYRKAYKTVILCRPARLLAFRKSRGGVESAAEKWKDIGLSSNNHSRTMVSQVSGPIASSSVTNTEQTRVSIEKEIPLETITQTNSAPSSSNDSTMRAQHPTAAAAIPTSLPATKTTNRLSRTLVTDPTLRDTIMTIVASNYNSNSSSTAAASVSHAEQPTLMKRVMPYSRLTLTGSDTIPEEEEDNSEPQSQSQSLAESSNNSTRNAHTTCTTTIPKRVPYYGQNMADNIEQDKVSKIKLKD